MHHSTSDDGEFYANPINVGEQSIPKESILLLSVFSPCKIFNLHNTNSQPLVEFGDNSIADVIMIEKRVFHYWKVSRAHIGHNCFRHPQ